MQSVRFKVNLELGAKSVFRLFLSNRKATPPSSQIHYAVDERKSEMDKFGKSFEDLPLTLSVNDLIPILNIGRNTAYSLVRCGRIQSIRVGRQIRIPKEALLQFLQLK